MSNQEEDSGINIFGQISQICREFRKLLAQGQTPKIEQYVAKVSESGRETVFSILLDIEINYRRRTNQSPSSGEYTRRFSQFSKQVRRAFFEPTMGSVDSASSLDDETRSLKDAATTLADKPTFDIPAANRLGDYRLLRELGRGEFGILYAAQHVRRHEIVALKTLPLGDYRDGPDDAERLYKFRREFRSLAEINHPSLVGM